MNKPGSSRNCRQCYQEIRGRSDKKFCSDYCRNLFHNRKNKESRSYRNKVDRLIRKNYKILNRLPKNSLIEKQELQKIGFDFNHFTGMEVQNDGKKYFFCYEHAYFFEERRKVRILLEEAHS